jgi:methylenetetrahydrofolate reductase (NADPH)
MSRSQLIAALRHPARPTVSVEFFPPKDEEGGARMLKVAATLKPLGIDFASLTYGAGGTSRDTTITYGAELVKMGIPLIGHLTCVGHSRAELFAIIEQYDLSLIHI